MTREEAIFCLKSMKNYARDSFTDSFTEQTEWQNSLDIAISALEPKTDVLDQIRAEIESKYDQCDICEYFVDYDYEENDISEYRSIGNIADILQIIDKYRKEI